MTERFDVNGSALLIMDYQPQILNVISDEVRQRAIVAVNAVGAAARRVGVPVIFVVVRYRADYLDANTDNKRVSLLRDRKMLEEGTVGVEIAAEVDRLESEPVVVKRRMSALAHTDLLPLLRSLRVTELYLAGVSTSGAVLSTVRGGADDDYRMVVIEDACADPNELAHEVLMREILPLHAEVMGSEAVVAGWLTGGERGLRATESAHGHRIGETE